jgi:hypothetical protein
MYNNNNAISFNTLAYNDYIAARVLLNNSLEIQGATMASTAIEKYIKVILAYHGKSKNVHLDKMADLVKSLNDCYFDVTSLLDKAFLEIIEKVYKVRYIDKITDSITFGFFLNQFLGELDYTVYLFENNVISGMNNAMGNQIKTQYHRAVDSKDVHLYQNNYLLNGQTKDKYMTMEDTGFSVQITPLSEGQEMFIARSQKMKVPYNGQIQRVNMDITEEKTTGPNKF